MMLILLTGHQLNIRETTNRNRFNLSVHFVMKARAVQRENKRRHIEAAKTLIQLNEELASQAGKNAFKSW